MNSGVWRERFLAVGLAVLLLIPFAGKAFHIDDPLFLFAAEQIRRHPADFFGFDVNWYGVTMPMSQVTKNPPLASYYIALVPSGDNPREWVLHLAFLLPAALLAAGTFELARRFCRRPLLAVALVMLCPAVLVSATSIMCDTWMAALWVWAVVAWLRGLDQDRLSWMTAGALLAGLAALTKYFGLCLIPLLAASALARTRRPGRWLGPLALPVVLLAAYQGHTHALYGRGLLFDAAEYATVKGLAARNPGWSGLVGLGFTGACMAPVLFLAPWLWRRRGLAAGALLAAMLFILFVLVAPQGTPPSAGTGGAGPVNWRLAAQFALWAAAGTGVWRLAAAESWRHRDADTLLLGLWLAGTGLFAVFVNWTVNARSLLPMAPALAVLAVRRFERDPAASGTRLPAGVWAALAGAAALALAVAGADHSLAGSARNAADRLAPRYAAPGHTLWFQGHWGFQYYMQKNGALPLDLDRPAIQPGDICVIPGNNTNIRFPPAETVEVLAREPEPVWRGLSTLSVLPAGAGFYSDLWGPLPFSFHPVPPPEYWVLRQRR